MRTLTNSILSTFILLVVPGGIALAQPAEVNRVLRRFDFEERQLGNPEQLPMYWAKVKGPGLPHYVNGRLSTDVARSGKYSFRFDLNGGGLVYRYEAGRIRVQPGAHYRVEGFCRTTVLPHARARLTAYFADVDGRPIAESIRHSDLYAAARDGEGWRNLSVELSAGTLEVASLVLELELLQPSHFAPPVLGERTINPQDIHGSAWFDDINVSQVPRVTMTTDRPGNIFRRSDPLRLQVLVNDRFTDDLAAQLVIRDAKGESVYQRSGALDISAAESLGPGQKKMSLDLPDDLKPGWYEAALVMSSQGQFVGEQTLDLVLLADDAPPVPADSRFGLIATDLPFEGWDELPDILPFLAAGRIKLAVWSEAGDVQEMDPGAFDHLLERLGNLGIVPTACLVGLPPKLAEKLGSPSWTQLLKARPEEWQPQLAYLVARHANHLDRWQLGDDGSDAFVTQPEMRQVYSKVYDEFATLVQAPDLAMPWPAWYDLEGELPATVALSVPPSVLPSQLPLYMQDLRGGEGHNLSLSLELLDRERYGRETQIRDLAQRVIYALAADASRIDLDLPFRVQRRDGVVVKQPEELLMVVRTLITTLSGTTFKGRVPICDGVEAFLFDRQGQGILAVWDRGSEGGQRKLALDLGDRPYRMDLWGNVTPLLRNPDDKRNAQVRLTVGPTPVFLIDVDGYMAQLRASVALDRPLLESSFQPHTRRFRFVNPYPTAIAGTVKIKAPAKGWTLSPPTFAFTLNPGEALDRELTIEFPYNSFSGPKNLTVEFAMQGETAGAFTVPLTLNLGLSDVGMQTIALRDGDAVVVQQMITNYGEKPIDYNAFAIYPGQARQERLVTNLGPGKTTVKKYRFVKVKQEAGVKVRVGVKEMEGTRILNDEVEIQ